jgi:hypothetical protein
MYIITSINTYATGKKSIMAINQGSLRGNVKTNATAQTSSNIGNNGSLLNTILPGDSQLARAGRSFLGSSANRLIQAGLDATGISGAVNNVIGTSQFAGAQDHRAKISLSPGESGILYKDTGNVLLRPLLDTNGVVFPYTPTVNVSYSANYGGNHPMHSNYIQHSYASSQVSAVNIVGQFSANNTVEANYLLAVLTFIRSSTKMFFGQDQNRGTPPPVLRFSYNGPYMFNSVPVVITNSTQDFEQSVDYIETNVTGGNGISSKTLVPTLMTINMTLEPIVSRDQQLNFGLQRYARGELVGSSTGIGTLP